MAYSKVGTGTVIIGISLVLSRMLGVLRDVLLADMVGIGTQKNAYDLAFLVPDIINHLISTGFLSITFIPIFTGYLVKNRENDAWDFFSNVLNVFGVLLVFLAFLAWFYTEPLILLLTSTTPDAETVALAVKYSRIIIPAQICFFVGAIFTAIQHIKLNFFIPALTGLIYNFSIILGGLIGKNTSVEGFVWGVVAGALLGSLILQIIGGKLSGAKYRFIFNPFQPELFHYFKITLPLIIGVGAVFSLEYVYRAFGPEFGNNGIAMLGYAYRVMFSIVAVFGFAVGVASYPLLAKLAKKQALDDINKILFRTLSKILALLAPTVLIVWFSAENIIQLLFNRGAFDMAATIKVAYLLKCYLLGAFAMSSQILIVRCFYALEKTWLPAIINTSVFLAFLPVYNTIGDFMGIGGIPIAGGICVTIQVLLLLVFWIRTAGFRYFNEFAWDSLKIFLIFLLGFVVLYYSGFSLSYRFAGSSFHLVTYLIIFSISVLGIMLWLQIFLRVSSTRELFSNILTKVNILQR